MLGFLEATLEVAVQHKYHLLDYEAAVFLPHLIAKLHEKQKRFRDTTRRIMSSVCKIFPTSKYAHYLLPALSKQQRNVFVVTEALDELRRVIGMVSLDTVLKVKASRNTTVLSNVVALVDDSRK